MIYASGENKTSSPLRSLPNLLFCSLKKRAASPHSRFLGVKRRALAEAIHQDNQMTAAASLSYLTDYGERLTFVAPPLLCSHLSVSFLSSHCEENALSFSVPQI